MTIPTAIAEFGEGCWILHEFNGAKWQYFENTSAAAEEVKKVSGYEGQAVRLRKNATTRLKEREDGETAISYHGYIWTIDSNVGSGALRPFRHSSRGLPTCSAPPRCGYWGSLGFFCSAPQDFGSLV